jgi:hypothetical protein
MDSDILAQYSLFISPPLGLVAFYLLYIAIPRFLFNKGFIRCHENNWGQPKGDDNV